MADDKPVRIRSRISAGYAINADHTEVFDGPPQSEWDAMTPEDKRAYLAEAAETTLSNNVEYWAEVVTGDEEDEDEY